MVQPLTYESLKHIVANDPTARDNLDDLKYMFRNEIGSARNVFRIRTVADLIDCLERHDALSEHNIEAIREIADEFGGHLAEIITFYQVPRELLGTSPYNEYREMRLVHECATRLNISDVHGLGCGQHTNVAPQTSANYTKPQPVFSQLLSNDKRAAIYKLIASDIGSGWRCLGRELEIRQGTMDDIEIQYRDLKTRVYKLFQAFEEDESIDPKQHLLIICRALDECRRKDLRRKVENIMSH